MKGIILAGGSGTRLFPITKSISKQLLPVYDKPMIYYPLSVLLMAGIKDILIITTPEQSSLFKKLLSDGSKWGINITYKTQPNPNGLAEAFIIGEDFIGSDNVALVLGDNIFHGHDFVSILKDVRASIEEDGGAYVFGSYVNDPERYGVVEYDKEENAVSIEEKPLTPKSNYAVVGLYFYDNSVVNIAKDVKPSKRGELEITTVNQEYLSRGSLKVKTFGRGFAWLDTGTFESFNDAANYIQTIEKRTGLKIGCIEEIAYSMGYINRTQMLLLAEELSKSEYGEYLKKLVK